MKVISIKEPYATLIMNGIKKIETRSWKTSYKGELFIHASISKIVRKNLLEDILNLVEEMDFNYGKIICRVNLVDCIYMDEEFINKIKKNKIEFICGEYKIGRYAWILDSIEPIYPIDAKGKLSFWNFDGEYKLLNKK